MASGKLPHMPFYVDDYEAATAHLTVEEDGIYFRLLRLCWRTPGCSVPDDAIWLARRMRMQGQYEDKIRPIMEEFFDLKNGRWEQKRLMEIFHEIKSKISERKKAGRRGGAAKALKNKETEAGKATILLQQNASKSLAVRTKGREEKKRVKRKTELPKDSPTQEDREKAVAYWLEKGVAVELDREVRRYRDHHAGKGSLWLDWSRVWSTWYGNAADYARRDGRLLDGPDEVEAEAYPG